MGQAGLPCAHCERDSQDLIRTLAIIESEESGGESQNLNYTFMTNAILLIGNGGFTAI